MNVAPSIDRLKKGDVIMLFGSKVKLDIREVQPTKKKMKGFNAKLKKIVFEFDEISKIIREDKIIYSRMEE